MEIHHTYAEYLQWPEKEGEKYELINGKTYMMASANWRHQRISGRLYSQISNYLEDKTCQVFYELDIRPEPKDDKSDDTVVRPDIVVVCDTGKLSKDGAGGVNGVPDLIVEVLSPSTANYDRIKKFNKYREIGVREFWIVDPETHLVEVNILENGKYTVSKYCALAKDEEGLENIPSKVELGIFENCVIDLERVFAEL